MTYAEAVLLPLGFRSVGSEEHRAGWKQRIVLSISHLRLQFDCVCPAYPNIKALGCPLHHNGPGGSWPVEEAKRVPTAIRV